VSPETQESFDQAFALGRKVVLLVEDEPIVRNVILLTLQRNLYAVLVAVDGQEALELSRAFEEEIDLLVTDMEMPRMSGDKLSELIVAERPSTRILQISGKFEDWFAHRNISLAFLHKPFLPSALIDKIHEVLDAPPGTMKLISRSASN
jgi:two-component system cell cycle sensor histidine kinase/response regulator CckA